MDHLPEFVQLLLNSHWVIWLASLVIGLFGAWLVMVKVGSGWLALFYFPGLVTGALAANQVLERLSISIIADKEVDAIVKSFIGATLVLLLLLVVTKFITTLQGIMTRAPYRKDLAQVATRRI